ncbi:MAG: ferredoxin [Actinomycetota bacterium]|nr:ferredoxin [Actinomycetota bacterium]
MPKRDTVRPRQSLRKSGRRHRAPWGIAIQIRIDRTACMGSGNCSFWAPATFDLDDEGLAVVVDPEGDPEERVVLAAQGCPTTAITVVLD